MCGIAGEVGPGALDHRRAELGRMVAAMKHRGPDEDGAHVADDVALGMCRLAIRDIAGGQQPIATPDGRWRIVYNGELYGAEPVRAALAARGCVFRTRTDTEIVLHTIAEHGARGLDALNGMFGFAVWDARERSLLLVRDRLGKKPLYYWHDRGRLVFASTLAAIEARADFAGRIDPQAVDLYLAHRFVTAPHTMYREVKKLPAGHLLRWRDGAITVEPWWDVPIPERPRDVSLDAAAEEVDALLADAARARLVSERPVGLCLSGGIDSGLIAHALRDANIETFSLGFAERDYDEAPAAARVAKSLGLRHHVLRAELDATRDLDAVLAHYDEPVADPSGVALFELSRLLRRHVTVALSGTGGDELFGGYRRILAGLMARVTRWLPAARLLPALLGRDETKLGWRGQLARLAGAAGLPPLDTYRGVIAPSTPTILAGLRRPELATGFDPASAFERHFATARGSLLTRLLYTDLKTVLCDDYLVKEDRMTMAHSVEGRLPFLDYRLVELAFSLPDAHKRDGLTGKVLLRRLAGKHLPAEIARAPKQGFEVPIAGWLRGALAERVRALASPDAKLAELLEPRAVKAIVDAHLDQRADHGRLLWTLLTLESWLARAKRAPEPIDAGPRPTRVMIVSPSLGEGGAQRVISTLLGHLDRSRFAPSLTLFKPVLSYGLPDDVPVHVIGDARDVPLADLARTRPWLVADLVVQLRKQIVREAPDVILSCIEQASAVTATALAGLPRRPRWIARIGTDPDKLGTIEAAWAGWALARADAVVVSSPALGDGLARRFPRTAPLIRAVANPVDTARIDALAAAPPLRRKDPARKLVIAVGRLSPEKRPDLMLDAIAALADTDLWLCGAGPLEAQVRADVVVRGLGDRVAVLGFCDNPYALLAQADVLLLTSTFEGMPNALIEAQALGVPAVAIDCPYGVRDVIADGETGVLVAPGDPAALVAALRALLADPVKRVTMSAAARARARARFGIDVLVEDWHRLLAERA